MPRSGGAESHIPGRWRIFWIFTGLPMAPGSCICTESRETKSGGRDGHGGRGPRVITELEQSAAFQFYPLPDGAICILSPDRRSISIIRPGKRKVAWHVPKSISNIGTISPSPDAKAIALGVHNSSFDSVLVATLHIESGRFTTIGTFAGRDPGGMTWLEDGSFIFVLREPLGNFAFYTIAKGHRPAARRPAVLEAQFSVSNDGRHAAVFSSATRRTLHDPELRQVAATLA